MNTTHAPVIPEQMTVVARELEQPSAEAGRLVVVVPDVGEVALLAGRIHEVAQARGQSVRLIGIPSESVPEIELRRKLALLAAFLRDAGSPVETRVEAGPDWAMGLRFLLNDQDLLACCTATNPQRGTQPLADLLASKFERSVYAFEDGDYLSLPSTNVLRRLAPWLSSIGVIVGFLWLQIQVSQLINATASTVLLLLTLPVEIGLIWLCNSSFA